MKKSINLLLGVLVTWLVVFLVGCGEQAGTNSSGEVLNENPVTEPQEDPAPVEYTYIKETVDYTEKNKQYSFRMDMERTDTDRAHYFFEKKVADEQRRACIEATEQILGQLGELPEVPEICVLTEKSYDSLFVVDNRVFLKEQDWQRHEYVTSVLMAVYGDFTHYGLAYGYANLLCQRLNWGENVEGVFVVPSVTEVCDLGLLCFDTAFVSGEDTNTAEKLACHFAVSCDEEELKQLISDSDTTEGMTEVSKALSEYYAANGLVYEPSVVRYGFGGVSYDYVVESDIGTFYLCDGWQDRMHELNPMVSENFLHENYAEVNEFFTINLRQMQQYRDEINLYPYDEDIRILFTNDPYLQVSQTNVIKNEIDIIHISAIMHEYIHNLIDYVGEEHWKAEGIARYLDLRHDYYGAPATTYDYNSRLDDPNFIFLKEYSEKIGRPLDMAVDYLTIYELRSYSTGILEGSAIFSYLAKQYGEQTMIQSIFGDGEPLPKTQDELIADCIAYLNETYRDYSKVEN